MKENLKTLERKLWDAADSLRANSSLTVHEYAQPVLGLIFLRFAEFKFEHTEKQLSTPKRNDGASVVRERKITPEEYQAKGIMYIPEKARYSYLRNLKESENIGQIINSAMKEIEEHNSDLKGVLPKTYTRLENKTLVSLLKTFSEIPMDIEGDMFGKIYEYFLSEFAMTEGQGGGEFFTPTSIVKLIVEVLEPYKGRVYDPACGSGGMFVQSANFVQKHKQSNQDVIAIYGQEKTEATVELCKMNLAVHGLGGDIKQGNTFYEDRHDSVGKFDFVMANPPFNVNGVDKEKIKHDPRYKLGIPSVDNGNYLWIEHFYESLNSSGRAGFVMANSASDARGTELEIRKKMIESGAVDVMIAIGNNFFYTVTLSCTLWFFDKGKKKSDRKDKILFIDARNIFTQIDRAHREFTEKQIEQIKDIVSSYRGEKGTKKYKDVKGLCKVATIKEVAESGYSLNPGRYVGTEVVEESEEDFTEKIYNLSNELEGLFTESAKLEKKIRENLKKVI